VVKRGRKVDLEGPIGNKLELRLLSAMKEKRRRASRKYSLLVNDAHVVLSLKNGKEKGKKIVVPNATEPRVVAPLPDIHKLVENARYLASQGLCGGTLRGNLNKYIHDREKEINVQILEIRKSLKRIERSLQCIDIVKAYEKGI